jgi:VanZ family protein
MMAAIFTASSIPNLTRLPGDFGDKTAHFWAYAALGALALRAAAGATWRAVSGRAAVIAWLIAATYAVTDEWHQAYVPGRSPSWEDWAADALGAAVAVIVILAVGRTRAGRTV